MSFPIQALNNNIIVRLATPDTISPGGTLLPPKRQQTIREGTVVSVGQGEYNKHSGTYIAPAVKPGDYVYVSYYSAEDVFNIDGDDYFMVDADAVYAKKVQE